MKKILISCLLVSALCFCSEQKEVTQKLDPINPSDFVDPFIGTGDHGHTYPGATVPFGMVQLSPDNGTQGWDWCSGYNYADSVIVGFSHTHLSGTGIGDLTDISIMPFQGTHDWTMEVEDHKEKSWASSFSHNNEDANPGYYSVDLNNGIKAELTASKRAGYHKYSFKQGENGILVDLDFAINWDRTTDSQLNIESGTTLTGYRKSSGWAKDQWVFFAIEFSEPFTTNETYSNGNKVESESISSNSIKSAFRFTSDEIEVKVGISSASIEGARKSLSEVSNSDFETVRNNASDMWKEQLSRIDIKSEDNDLNTTFMTALYHTMVAPVLFEDLNKEYKGADSLVHKAEGYTRYDIFSLWDTFRAENPLLTLIQPGIIDDLINSMLAHYEEYGLLPVWSLLGNETNTMTGYHAIPVIADAYLKGFDGFDAELAFEAMKKSAMQDIRGTDLYREYGYIPYDLQGQSVTKTLEYAYDDWCIAQMAKKMNKMEDYELFMTRAASYRQLFDPETKFMRAKLADGSWKSPFDPKFSDHNFDVAEYTEGNAWQHSWFVPHDIRGLIDLHGGNEPFADMLDSLFNEDSEISGDNKSADISGLIGQYAHGNEPSHHIAYMYNYAGMPWKTQEMINEIVYTMYNSSPTGLCGNEDCGQMSAWYVFSAMGLYPVNPSQGIYVIGSPQFEEVSLNLGSKPFVITAEKASRENPYIQSAKLNGEELIRTYITHDEILSGGNLEFVMGSTPNKEWGSSSDTFPPSMSDHE